MRPIVGAALALTFAACAGGGNQTGVALSSGTSFGMCAGYCVTELRIDSTTLSLTEEAWRSEQPTRTRTLPLARAEWERLQALVDTADFRRLEGVHGCPDCADGGAEWIEIQVGEPVRITFDYGAELDGIEDLQAEIRALRARFER